jgi:threonine dehydratase
VSWHQHASTWLGSRQPARVINPIFLDTPLHRCEPLETSLGCKVSIKLETANPVRSFKARGAEVIANLLAGNGSRALVCASAGNCRRRVKTDP